MILLVFFQIAAQSHEQFVFTSILQIAKHEAISPTPFELLLQI